MKNPSKIQNYSGLDLGPMPHESAFSIVLRFSERNGLQPTKLFELIEERQPKPYSTYTSSWWNERSAKLMRAAKWEKLNYHEDEYDRVGFLHCGTLPQLRICPICQEHRYHSYWFQFNQLEHCPFHQCKLTIHCQSCGSKLPKLSQLRQLIRRPYICIECNKPICGNYSTIQDHVEFRQHANELIRAFAPLYDWLQKAQSMSHFNQSICEWKNLSSMSGWCRPQEILPAFLYRQVPLPAICSTPLYPPVELYKWRVRRSSYYSPEGGTTSYDKEMLRKKVTPVYRSILFHLQHWLFQIHKQPYSPDFSIAPEFHQDGIVDLGRWDPRELAYMLLRYFLEKEEAWGLYGTVENARLSKPEAWDQWIREKRTVRRAWRLYFLANYMGLVHLIMNAKKIGHLDLKQIRSDYGGFAAEYHNEPLGYVGGFFPVLVEPIYNEGGVICLPVKDFPINLFATSRRVKKIGYGVHFPRTRREKNLLPGHQYQLI